MARARRRRASARALRSLQLRALFAGRGLHLSLFAETAELKKLLKQRINKEAKLMEMLQQRNDAETQIEQLKNELEQEQKSWQLATVSSTCTSVRFGVRMSVSSDMDTCCGNDLTVAWTSDQSLDLPSLSMSNECQEQTHARLWEAWCPCCRRPLEIRCIQSEDCWETQYQKSSSQTLYAYVAVLWGSKSGFVLGALALAACLKRSGTKNDLVLLHTDDIPQSSLDLLGKVWKLNLVEFVIADQRLFGEADIRFQGVFTKLHALRLIQYTKVILLDLDIVVLSNIDDLFGLPAPAATHRRGWGNSHNTKINGTTFFGGDGLHDINNEIDWRAWGQSGGINAGLVLLAPDQYLYKRIMKELKMPMHPAHVSGSGPEQDYLSRLYAPWWTHIGVAYNFQPHRTFHALETALDYIANAYDPSNSPDEFPERLKQKVDELKVVHLCGNEKIWDHLCGDANMPWLENNHSDIAEKLLKSCAGSFCNIWQDLQATEDYYSQYKLQLKDGNLIPDNAKVHHTVKLLIGNAIELAVSATTRSVKS